MVLFHCIISWPLSLSRARATSFYYYYFCIKFRKRFFFLHHIAKQILRFYFRNPLKMFLCIQTSFGRLNNQQKKTSNLFCFFFFTGAQQQEKRNGKKNHLNETKRSTWENERAPLRSLSLSKYFGAAKHIYKQEIFVSTSFFSCRKKKQFIIKLWEKWASKKKNKNERARTTYSRLLRCVR